MYNQMVVEKSLTGIGSDGDLADQDVDRMFRALADSTRRDILRRGLTEETSVSALAEEYDMSFAAVQKHVAVLEAAGLVIKRAEGRMRMVRTDPERLQRAQRVLEGYVRLWRGRVDRLDVLLAEES